MNAESRPPDDLSDQRLDQLLESASWPAFDESRLQHLESHWARLLDEAPPTPKPTRSRRQNLPWMLAIATMLLVGCSVWLTLDPEKNSRPADLAREQPRTLTEPDVTEPASRPPGRHSTAEDSSARDAVSPPAAPAPAVARADYLAGLARARQRRIRRVRTMQNSRLAGWTESASDWIGQTPWLASATQVLVHHLDRQFLSLRSRGDLSRPQFARYTRWRQDWERRAWHRASSGKSRHPAGAARFAIAVSTRQSLGRLEHHLQFDGVLNEAAAGIAHLGESHHIDRAIRLISGKAGNAANRARKQLLLAMLRQPGPQPARLFLDYLRAPSTSQLALEIANSTDQLPADVWLESIARQDRWRLDSALAVARICDRRVIDGLIRLAGRPSTSRTALMALVKSPCPEAKNFIAYAESDYQLVGPLSMARRKLSQMEERARPSRHRKRRNLTPRL